MSLSIHKDFPRLLEALLSKERFLLTTHVRPDPDGWGAQLGLYCLLEAKSKDVIIYNQDPYEGEFFRNNTYGAQVYHEEQDFDRSILAGRTIVSVDNSSIERLGKVASYVKEDHSNLIVIDHHDEEFPDESGFFIFPKASSASEIICALFVLAREKPPLEIANALYIGIVCDSGFFRYSKTTPLTHRLTARLLGLGVEPAKISEQIHAAYNFNRLKVRNILYKSLESTEDKRIAWLSTHVDSLKAVGASLDDLDGLIDDLFEAKEVEIAILFSQRAHAFTRVAFRSRYGISLLPVAEKLGGGGHKSACGASIELDLEKTINKVITLTKKCLP